MYKGPAELMAAYPGMCAGKTNKRVSSMLAMAVLGGAFVALAAMGTQMVSVLLDGQPVAKLIGALLFPAGLGMILIIGAELFTGNCMIPMAVAAGEVKVGRLLRSWGIVYVGNFLGAVLIGWLAVAGRRSDAAFLAVVADGAAGKLGIGFWEVFLRGILCNVLVCAAVWMSYSAGSTAGKMVAMYFPVALFVLCGTEHCVANMYYLAAGFFVGGVEGMTLQGVLVGSLLPATLGNIVGGSVVFSGLLWVGVHGRKQGA